MNNIKLKMMNQTCLFYQEENPFVHTIVCMRVNVFWECMIIIYQW